MIKKWIKKGAGLKTFGLCSLIILFTCRTPSFGEEVWVEHFPHDVNWDAPLSLATLKGNLYLAARKNISNHMYRLEADGKWGYAYSSFAPDVLVSHDNRLYAFFSTLGFPDNYPFLRTEDGVTWDIINSSLGVHQSFLTYSDAISFGDHIYIATRDGYIYRSTGDGNPVIWDEVFNDPNSVYGACFNLIEFKGRLHVVVGSHFNSFQARIAVHRMEDDESWTSLGSFLAPRHDLDDSILSPICAVFENKLYVGNPGLWITSGDQEPYVWEQITISNADLQVPAVIFDQLHLMGPDLPVMVLNEDGNWEKAASLSIPLSYSAWGRLITPSFTEYENTVYIEGEHLHTLSLGVSGVKHKSIQNQSIFAGESGPVLGMIVNVNIRENLTFKVTNEGTAQAGVDIKNVRLVKSNPSNMKKADVGGFSVNLIADSMDPKVWQLPTQIEVKDEDELTIWVDTSDSPSPNATCRFKIEPGDFTFENNPAYTLNESLIASKIDIKEKPINAAPDSIAEVLIFPQPAEDEVRFKYDLTSVSDIIIKIFNRKGVLVSEINEPQKPSGTQETAWNASQMARGVYFCHIELNPTNGSPRKYTEKVFLK